MDKEGHVCSYKHVKWIDNFLRRIVHNPGRLFKPYVQPGMTVLDVGCGAGFASLGLAKLVGESGHVISADLQPEMLDIVRERAAKKGLSDRIKIHLCQADRVGVQEKVDFALAFWMLHETPDIEAFLEEIFMLLKPGGRFFVADPISHVSKGDFEQSIQKAQEIGFTVLSRPRVFYSRAVVLMKRA